MLVKINITQKHIDESKIYSKTNYNICNTCPTALALKDVLKEKYWQNISVGFETFQLSEGNKLLYITDLCGYELENLIRSATYPESSVAHHKSDIKPLSFELDIPQEYLKEDLVLAS